MANSQPKPAHPIQSPSLLRRLAWLPVPLLALTIAGLWIADLRGAYESPFLLLLLNFVCSMLASGFVAFLIARSFLVRRMPGLLLLGCGVIAWGAAGLVGVASGILGGANGRLDINLFITIHNLCAWLSAVCHLAGAASTLRPQREIPAARLWLAAAYTFTLAAVGLITVSALANWTPVFFIQGQGGTLIRLVVLGSATAMFGLSAALLGGLNPRSLSPFVYWYTLALGLIAVGLFGIMIESVHASALSWTGRAAQFLSGVYMLIAAVAAARDTGTWRVSLASVEEAGGENALVAGFRQQKPLGWMLRYGLAVGAVAAAMGLRQGIAAWGGPGLPPYITLYPMVMAVALVGGFGPGLVATVVAGLATTYWILPPVGFDVESPVDRIGLVIFVGMGLFMSVVAEFYRRYRQKSAAYDREAALRESQARLATFAAATFEGIIESEAGRIVDCNEQAEGMLGYTLAELRGMELVNLVAPEDRERVVENIRQGRQSVIEHEMLRKDGRRIVIEAQGQPLFPDSETRLTAIRDITQRKRAEEALRESRERLDLALVSSGMANFEWDIVQDQRTWSQGIHDLLGTKPETFAGTAEEFFQAIHPEDRSAVRAALARAVGTTSKYETEYRALRPDGSIRHIAARGTVHRDLAGQAVRMTGVCWDITQRKRAEEALRESGRFINAVAEASPHWFYVFDLDRMDLSYVNRPILGDLGYPPAVYGTVTGLDTFRAYMPPEEMPHLARVLEEWRTLPAGLVRDDEYRLRHADGTLRYFAGREVVFTRRSDDTAQQILGLLLDITERKRAEEALRVSNLELTRFNRVTVGRELRIIELKKQVNELCAKLGQPPRYATEPEERAQPTT